MKSKQFLIYKHMKLSLIFKQLRLLDSKSFHGFPQKFRETFRKSRQTFANSPRKTAGNYSSFSAIEYLQRLCG